MRVRGETGAIPGLSILGRGAWPEVYRGETQPPGRHRVGGFGSGLIPAPAPSGPSVSQEGGGFPTHGSLPFWSPTSTPNPRLAWSPGQSTIQSQSSRQQAGYDSPYQEVEVGAARTDSPGPSGGRARPEERRERRLGLPARLPTLAAVGRRVGASVGSEGTRAGMGVGRRTYGL